MEPADLARLTTYDRWANQEALASLRRCGTPPPRALEIMGHIVGAAGLWLARIEGTPAPLPVWPRLGLEECERESVETAGAWERYARGLTAAMLARRISYVNSKGDSWSSRVSDIATHLVFHSAYHRGQIAMLVRGAGQDPAYTDFIRAVREGLVE